MIKFPHYGSSGIVNFTYWLVESILSWGWVGYGFAIVLFTIFLKLILSPLDFLNRFLTRRNQIKQQALAGEVADLNRTYANDPMAFVRARQELYRKNGVGGLGSSLVTILSLVVTMVVFFHVMSALNSISQYNIYQQYCELDAVYQEYKDGDEAVLKEKLNATYNETNTSFMWVKNIWRPDTFWDSPKMSSAQAFNSAQSYHKLSTDQEKADYEAMYAHINAKSGNNGIMLLALLAGVTSFLSSKLSMLMTKRQAKRKAAEETKTEPIITYSMRDARNQVQGGQKPEVDPQQVAKIMQYVMPLVLVIFAIMQTSAFAIYMIASSLVSTGLTLLFTWLIDLIFKHVKPKAPKQDFDATVINPHAKYFKGGKK